MHHEFLSNSHVYSWKNDISTIEEEKVDQDSETDEVDEEGDEGGAMVQQKNKKQFQTYADSRAVKKRRTIEGGA